MFLFLSSKVLNQVYHKVYETVYHDLSSNLLSQNTFIISASLKNEVIRICADINGHTIVLGSTGTGKSLLIGYLLGARLEKIYHQTMGRWVLDYRDPIGLNPYPIIGHTKSQTKGYNVCQSYIDTAGFFDTGGCEENIRNARAIAESIETYSPKRIIVVLTSNDFSESRSAGFLSTIHKIQKIFSYPIDDKILSSILFVINDRDDAKRSYSNKTLYLIKPCITICKEERDNELRCHYKDEWKRGLGIEILIIKLTN